MTKVSVQPTDDGLALALRARDALALVAVSVLTLLAACGAETSSDGPMAGAPGGGTGGGGSGAGGMAASGGGATFTAVNQVFVTNNCGLCHSQQTLGGGLVFDPANKMGTFMALVGTMSKGTMGSSCAGKTYVVPGQPDASLLYDKISKPMPICGLRMPASGVVLTDMEIATVRSWIMGGAQFN